MFPDHMWFAGVWFFSIFFLVILIFAGFFLLRGGRFGSFKSESETPLDILKKRYANGEISKEEFDRMKQDIS